MRLPKPWFRTSKNAWFVEQNGVQVRLGLHPENALPPKKSNAGWNPPEEIQDAFYKLMARDLDTMPKAQDILTAQVCDLFLDHAERHNEPATYRWYKYFLQDFCERHGRITANDLKPIHVTRWLLPPQPLRGGVDSRLVKVNSETKLQSRVGS